MSEQYLRQASLIVGTADLAVDLSALRIKFKVNQHTLESPNNAVIRVWNLSDGTGQLLRDNSEGAQVTLQVGYGGGSLGQIFVGDLIQVRKGRENALDSYVDIIAGDGDQAYNFSIVNQPLAAGSTPNQRVAAAIQAMGKQGVTAGPIADLGSSKLPRGVSLFGMPRDHLRDIAATNECYWSIQSGQVQMVPITAVLPGQAIVLSSATGMIGVPEVTADGIHVRCLINPLLKVNGAIQIDNASITEAQLSASFQGVAQNALIPSKSDDGFYKALFITHEGDTRGNEWYSDIICIGYDQGAPAAFITSGKLA